MATKPLRAFALLLSACKVHQSQGANRRGGPVARRLDEEVHDGV